MKPRFTYLAGFAVVHLLLVVCGAAHIRLVSPELLVGRWLGTYGALSGSNTGYSFFAPRVSPELKVEFVLSDAAGQEWTDTADWAKTSEARLRFLSSISMVNSEEMREGVAVSWAAALFGRYPQAESVRMRVCYQDLPTLAEYRDGDRPTWKPVFEAEFSRSESLPVTNALLVRND